jgi:hypothetical protein
MTGQRPTRSQGDLAEMLETLLDKGVVINADIAVTVGDAELLSIHIRAAIASFETAAAYGLEFPSGTNTDRVAEAAGIDPTESERSVPVGSVDDTDDTDGADR